MKKHWLSTILRNSIYGLLLTPLLVACFALSQPAQAVTPAPDGGYPGFNTAEGTGALQSLTSGLQNTAIGFDALSRTTTGNDNTALGLQALFSNTTGFENAATGWRALFGNTTGFHNTADGFQALASNTTGNHNTADGDIALVRNTTGSFNAASGAHALAFNTTGSSNIALGFQAGAQLTTGSNNIDIGNMGVAAESHTIRIGAQGTHTRTLVAGISGTAVTGSPVVVNSTGQLGVAASSAHFKDMIKPMDKASEAILALKPVTFRYKKELDPETTPQFGLVAEEVEKVNPDLVVRDAKGKVYSVRYEAVNAMLLNEFLKEHRRVQQQETTITELKSTVAQQQKVMEGFAATLKEQASQIQEVNAQLQVSKPAPQMVINNQ